MSQRLPNRPHFELLRRHAKDVLRVGRLLYPAWRLADAQQALARGHGFANWADLKRDVELRRGVTRPSRDAPISDASAPVQQTRADVEPACIAGHWLSHDEATPDRVALEIAAGGPSLLLTQVVAPADDRAVGNSLTIRPDGREHALDIDEELRIQATWSDPRTVQTTVRRGGVIVAEGAYVVSADGNTMTATSSGRARTFTRVGALLIGPAVMAATCACAGVVSRRTIEPRDERADADRRAIDALNRHDIAAGLASDADAVVSQWTDDFVLLPPAGPIVRGKAANAAMVEQARPQLEKFVPVAYEVQFDEITVAGNYAFAWGTFRTVARVREAGSDIASSGKLLRIYQRQPDGRWLMHRTMSTIDPPPRSLAAHE